MEQLLYIRKNGKCSCAERMLKEIGKTYEQQHFPDCIWFEFQDRDEEVLRKKATEEIRKIINP